MSKLEQQQQARAKAFRSAFEKGDDLGRLVDLARPVMAEAIKGVGIDCSELEDTIAALVGKIQRDEQGRVAWEDFGTYIYAAHALGIALGHFVQPEMFTISDEAAARSLAGSL